jgi:membrane-associated protease RseP (regulator of RpoE activity)
MTSPFITARRGLARCTRVAGSAVAGLVLLVSMAAAAEGYLGVYMQEVTASLRRGMDLPRGAGVLVSGVEEEGPADKSGLREGDVITKVDGRTVGSPSDLREAIREAGAGHAVTLDVWRDGDRRNVTVTLGAGPSGDTDRDRKRVRVFVPRGGDGDVEIEGDDAPRRREIIIESHGDRLDDDAVAPRAGRGGYLGVGLTDLTPQLGEYFGVRSGGVLVTSVADDSPARAGGLRAGDVIVSVGDDDIDSAEDLRRAVRSRKPGSAAALRIVRDRTERTIEVTLGKAPRAVSLLGPGGSWNELGRGMVVLPNHREFAFDEERLNAMLRRHKGRDVRRELDRLREEVEKLHERLEEGEDDEEDDGEK